MKKIFLLLGGIVFYTGIQAQNVGIGTSNPTEKLEVNGGLKIGNSSQASPGTIRWNNTKNDFEGYNGNGWVSLTGGKSRWGNQSAYTYENQASQHTLIYSSTNSNYGYHLGESLSLHNGLLAAGAWGDYNIGGNMSYSGNVYLYKKTLNGWTRVNMISNPDPDFGDGFGISVSTYNHKIIAGAFRSKINGVKKGEAYIFHYDAAANLYTPEDTLQASDGQEDDDFGTSVSITDSFAIVGAPLNDITGLSNSGAAYVYKKTANGWSQISYLTPPDRAQEDQFGNVVALSGNWAAVAAYKSTLNGFANAGKVYLYRLNAGGTGYFHTHTLTSDSLSFYGRFGASLQLSGDTLLVGATEFSGNPTDGPGAVYYYVWNGSNWVLQQKIRASDGRPSAAFGYSLQMSGGQLIVGATYATVGSNEPQGKAYMFRLNGNLWQEEAILVSSHGSVGDLFGYAVTTDGQSAVVAARSEDFKGYNNHGRLYFYWH